MMQAIGYFFHMISICDNFIPKTVTKYFLYRSIKFNSFICSHKIYKFKGFDLRCYCFLLKIFM